MWCGSDVCVRLMPHAKRLLPVVVVVAVISAYVLYDFGAVKFPTRRILNIPKDAGKSIPSEAEGTPVEQQSGDGGLLELYGSEGVDIENGESRENVPKHLTEIGFTDNIAQLAGHTEAGKGQRKRRLPQAIIIGVKKGGTRALLQILNMHPQVRASSHEVHFFDRDENYELGLRWYREQMPLSFADEITMEKSPSYFVTPKVPSRIHEMSPSVKLILIVRDPTLRAISDYTQSLSKHPENPPFEETVMDDRGANVNSNWSKIVIGRYAQHLNRWLKFFPAGQIHIVSGEELIKNPAVEIKPVEKFLGLKPFITENNFFFNETKGFFCFIGTRGQDGRRKAERQCMGSSKGRKHPHIRQEVLKMVQDYFRPYNKEFYSLAKRKFNWP